MLKKNNPIKYTFKVFASMLLIAILLVPFYYLITKSLFGLRSVESKYDFLQPIIGILLFTGLILLTRYSFNKIIYHYKDIRDRDNNTKLITYMLGERWFGIFLFSVFSLLIIFAVVLTSIL